MAPFVEDAGRYNVFMRYFNEAGEEGLELLEYELEYEYEYDD